MLDLRPKYKDLVGGVILNGFCNIFGDDINGATKMLGGLSSQSPERQWYCPMRWESRWRMECEHGHVGQIMKLCPKHLREFQGKVSFCPPCNSAPPGHKCNLTLKMVS